MFVLLLYEKYTITISIVIVRITRLTTHQNMPLRVRWRTPLKIQGCSYVYIYIYIHMFVCIYIYIYIYILERDLHTYVCVYIYIYVHIHIQLIHSGSRTWEMNKMGHAPTSSITTSISNISIKISISTSMLVLV